MKAVSCLDGSLSVVEMPSPEPSSGQLLIEVRRCGICGSDLHAKDHAGELADVTAAVGYDHFMRRDTPVVLGHEFCGEVAARGRGVPKEFKVGALVVALPLIRAQGGVHLTGLSPLAPGAFAERVLAQAAMSFVVPNGLDQDTAALTEPMAVALHAVRRAEIGKRDAAVVIGCGPVGLAVICHLVAIGVRTIVASDPSPARRELARRCGAHVVVDPATESPYAELGARKGVVTSTPELYELGVGSMEKLRKLPGWVHLYRLADGVIAGAPVNSLVVVVGVCMNDDKLRPALAIVKEVELRFAFGYTPLDFRDALHLLAEGKVNVAPLVTAVVGLDGVAAAFTALTDPERHAKILIDPASTATAV